MWKMGNQQSSDSGRTPGGSSYATPSKSAPTPLIKDEAPTFYARPVRGFPRDCPKSIYVKMDKEALLVIDTETLEVVRTFSYYRILCWGSTDTTFVWKAYADDTELDLNAFGIIVEAVAKLPSASLAVSPSSVAGAGGAATPGSSVKHPFPAPASFQGHSLGPVMEETLMGIVQALMSDMKATGVGDEAFAGLINTLTSLADEGWADHCLTVVKQMTMGRALDARQATQIVQTVGTVSPFDKLEAAIALFPSLMSPQSFLVVLQAFDDAGERDNILHRLGLRVGASGQLEQVSVPKTPGGAGVGPGGVMGSTLRKKAAASATPAAAGTPHAVMQSLSSPSR